MLSTLVKKLVHEELQNVHVSLPGKVVKYDSKSQKAQIKPLSKIAEPIYADKIKQQHSELTPESFSYKELDVIFNVPVKHYSANNGKTFIHFPIKKNDIGMLVFTSYPINEYVNGAGDLYNVKSGKNHDLNNAYFLPGVLPFGAALKDVPENDLFIYHEGNTLKITATSVVVKADKATFTMNKNGTFKLEGSAAELLDLIVKLITDGLIAATVPTMMGPQVLSTVTTGKLVELAGLITGLKG